MAGMCYTGEEIQDAGVYVCLSCGHTVTLEQGQSLPDCPREEKAVEWRREGEHVRRRGQRREPVHASVRRGGGEEMTPHPEQTGNQRIVGTAGMDDGGSTSGSAV